MLLKSALQTFNFALEINIEFKKMKVDCSKNYIEF